MGLSLIFRLDSNQEKQLLTIDKQEQLNLLFSDWTRTCDRCFLIFHSIVCLCEDILQKSKKHSETVNILTQSHYKCTHAQRSPDATMNRVCRLMTLSFKCHY